LELGGLKFDVVSLFSIKVWHSILWLSRNMMIILAGFRDIECEISLNNYSFIVLICYETYYTVALQLEF